MDCGGRNSGMAHSNGDLMQIADYISSSIEASNGGLLVTSTRLEHAQSNLNGSDLGMHRNVNISVEADARIN